MKTLKVTHCSVNYKSTFIITVEYVLEFTNVFMWTNPEKKASLFFSTLESKITKNRAPYFWVVGRGLQGEDQHPELCTGLENSLYIRVCSPKPILSKAWKI